MPRGVYNRKIFKGSGPQLNRIKRLADRVDQIIEKELEEWQYPWFLQNSYNFSARREHVREILINTVYAYLKDASRKDTYVNNDDDVAREVLKLVTNEELK